MRAAGQTSDSTLRHSHASSVVTPAECDPLCWLCVRVFVCHQSHTESLSVLSALSVCSGGEQCARQCAAQAAQQRPVSQCSPVTHTPLSHTDHHTQHTISENYTSLMKMWIGEIASQEKWLNSKSIMKLWIITLKWKFPVLAFVFVRWTKISKNFLLQIFFTKPALNTAEI